MDLDREQRRGAFSKCHWRCPHASDMEDHQSWTTSPVETTDRATNDDSFKLRSCSDFTESAWKPFYLQKPFLLGLATTCAVMIVALEVLLNFSNKNHGLATVQESWYYSWKFGPTIVFTIVASLWAQVEHRTGQLMPWYLMSRGQASAESSLLLNYLTPFRIVSLWKSLRRRHWLVGIGTSGSLILGLLIILSTSLLSLEQRPIAKTFVKGEGFTTLDRFNLTKAPPEQDGNGFFQSPGYSITNTRYYWGMYEHNVPRPNGMTSEHTFQTFKVPDIDLGPYSTTTTDVQVVASTIEDCKHFYFTMDVPEDTKQLHGSTAQRWLPQDYLDERRAWCSTGGTSDFYGTPLIDEGIGVFSGNFSIVLRCPVPRTNVSSDDHRWMLSLTTPRLGNLSDVAVLICKPTYSMSRRTITNQYVDRNYTQSRVGSTIHETFDLDLPTLNLTTDMMSDIKHLGPTSDSPTPWHALLNFVEPQPNNSSFMNMTLVENLSRKVWAELFALRMKRYCTDPTDQMVDGSVIFVQWRLCVQPLAVRLTEPFLALLGIGAIALAFMPLGLFYRDPGCLGAHALILARSPGLMHLLGGYGTRSLASTRALACKYSFSTPLDHSPESQAIRVEPPSSVDLKRLPEDAKFEAREAWRPMSLTWAFQCSMIVIPTVFSIALEVLLQISNAHNGLGNVVVGSYQQYTWTYIPTLAIAAQNLLFSTADSTARILHPFQALSRGGVNLQEIFYDPSTQTSLAAIFRAFSRRQWAFVAILFTGLLTPLLPIFTSGLFTPQPIVWEHHVTLQMKDWFDLGKGTMDQESTDNAMILFELAQYSNMTDPQWTREGYVFPQFGNTDLGGYSSNTTLLNITARMPTVRANMNCSFEKYMVNRTSFVPTSGEPLLLDPPAGCEPRSKLNGTGTRPLYLKPFPGTGYFPFQDGYFVASLYDRGDPVNPNIVLTELDASSAAVCGDGRQHYWYAAGHQTENMTDEVSVVHCTPHVEALYATVTLNLPSLTMDERSSVVPDQASLISLANSSAAAAIGSKVMYDFIDVISNGVHGTPLRELSGEANVGRFISILERTYRSYAMLNLHVNYRRALPTTTTSNNNDDDNNTFASSPFVTNPVIGVIRDGNRLRLVQSGPLTRTLEAILLVLAGCAAASVVLGRGVACVLPMDPGSVAAKMCLLAGGRAWSLVPEGAERLGDDEVERSGLFRGWRFRLGWWGGDAATGDQEGRFAIDGVPDEGYRDDLDSLLCCEDG